MFSKLTKAKVTSSLPSFAKQLVRVNQCNNQSRWISISSGNSALTKNNQKQLKEKLKLEQQAEWCISKRFSSNHHLPISRRLAVHFSEDEFQGFMSVFPEFVSELKEKVEKHGTKMTADWLAKAIQYNALRGKKVRALQMMSAYKSLVNDQSQLTPENIRLLRYLGWCVEILQASILIVDDMIDGGQARRGQPCWHTLDDVKMIAANDCLLIENCAYYMLKKHFSHLPCYLKLIELFQEAMFITTIGQEFDLMLSKLDVSKFTMEFFQTLAHNKTCYYTIYHPIALAMNLAGYEDPEIFRQVKTIAYDIGKFYQVQNDFIDCFGTRGKTGKIGTDIQDNKCTWLAIMCMQRANETQKQIMIDCYGKNDEECVRQVKQLYEDLDLVGCYRQYEEDTFNSIRTNIQQTARNLPHSIFYKAMDIVKLESS